MDHETFKNIPVIMMSSHDSISMVFKCMSKGAVDFLVKSIRKNELMNLWQHVWRRHISNGQHSDTQGHQDEDSSKKKSENYLSEHVASIQEHKEGSEKGSDAQIWKLRAHTTKTCLIKSTTKTVIYLLGTTQSRRMTKSTFNQAVDH